MRAAGLLSRADLLFASAEVTDRVRHLLPATADLRGVAELDTDPRLLVKAAKAGQLAVVGLRRRPAAVRLGRGGRGRVRQGAGPVRDRAGHARGDCGARLRGHPADLRGRRRRPDRARRRRQPPVGRWPAASQPGHPGGRGRAGRPGQDADGRRLAGAHPVHHHLERHHHRAADHPLRAGLGDRRPQGGRGQPAHRDRPRGRRGRRGRRGPAGPVLVRDQAAVRLAGAGAADQGAGRSGLGAAAGLRRGAGGGADHRGRAAPHPAADGARGQGPGHRPVPVGRVHLGQRGPRGPREARRVRAGRAGLRRGEGRRGRRADRAGRCSDFGIKPDLVPEGEQSGEGLAAAWQPYDSRVSTRSTGCCCRGPTSPPRRWSPGSTSWAGKPRTSPPTGPCGPRRRPRRSARRSRAAGSTPCCSPPPRRCAT